jgi:hypothetical protein
MFAVYAVNSVEAINSKNFGEAEHVTSMIVMRNGHQLLFRKAGSKLGDIHIDWRMTSKWVLRD